MSSNFQLSKQVDPNKVFLIKVSELERRLDPHFYKPLFRKNVQKTESVPNDNLGNIVRFSDESWDQKSIFSMTFPYVEIGEIDLLTGEINQINNVNIEGAPSRAKMIVRNGDILVSTTRPSRGAISHFENDGLYIASTGFSIIRKLITTNISKRFLFYWLRQPHALWQMEQRSSGGNYPAITQEELARVKIPIPPKEVQAQIVAKMDAAYIAKKQKEAEARRLLDSIDDYLLGKLGIELPEQEENTIASRMFTRRWSEISVGGGGRFDAEYNQEKYTDIERSLNSSKYKLETLSNVIKYKKGIEVGSKNYVNTGIPFVRVADIDDWGVNTDNCNKYIAQELFETLKDDFMPQKNELIYSKDGTIGYTAIISESTDMIVSGGLLRIIPSKEVSINYLQYILSCSIFKHFANRESIGAIIKHLNIDKFTSLKIPLPSLEKQNEIAEHISQIRQQAKQHQNDAEIGLEQAKKEVETMILG